MDRLTSSDEILRLHVEGPGRANHTKVIPTTTLDIFVWPKEFPLIPQVDIIIAGPCNVNKTGTLAIIF